MIIRSAKLFEREVVFIDNFGIMDNISHRETIIDFASGAIDNLVMITKNISNIIDLGYEGRFIATDHKKEKSIELLEFDWQKNDHILVGNEYTGLPKEIFWQCDFCVTIRTSSKSLVKHAPYKPIYKNYSEKLVGATNPCLNVAMAASISSYIAWMKMNGLKLA